MLDNISLLAALLLACPLLLTGCNSTPTDEAAQATALQDADPFVFPPSQYPRVHRAAADVLREHGFVIARNDYRFGVITTEPKEAPTSLEFWIDDPTTPTQHQADTLNAQQRRVAIRTKGDQTTYSLTVEVMVERLQRPARYLTHSATTRLSADYAATPAHLRDRGIDANYAQRLTRDPHLEARLRDAIAQRASEVAEGDTPPPAPSAE